MTNEAVLAKLGERLYFVLEHLDPTVGGQEWEQLSDAERDLYIVAVTRLLDARTDVILAMGLEIK